MSSLLRPPPLPSLRRHHHPHAPHCLPTGAPDAASALAAFDALAAVACVSRPRVTLAQTARGRGLITTAPVAAGDRLITIDRAAALVVADTPSTAGVAAARAAAADAAALCGPLPPLLTAFTARASDPWFERLLALFLHALFCSPTNSIGRLYAATLPPPLHVTALAAFSPAERALLPPELASIAASDAAALETMHTRLFDAGTGALGALALAPTPAATRTAAALLNSRCFADSVGGAPLSLAVPLVDLANHEADAPTAQFALDGGGTAFGLRATRPLAAGEEVTISYTGTSPKSNPAMMKDYGFVLGGNGADAVALGARGALVDARLLAEALAKARADATDAVARARLDAAARSLTPHVASATAGGGATAVAAAAKTAAAEARAAATTARTAATTPPTPDLAPPRALAAADAWEERAAVADAVVVVVQRVEE